MAYLLFFLEFFHFFGSHTLFCIIAPLNASEIEFGIGNPVVALFTSSSRVVLEEFEDCLAERAFALKDIILFPVASILTWAFHCVGIITDVKNNFKKGEAHIFCLFSLSVFCSFCPENKYAQIGQDYRKDRIYPV